MEVILNNEKVTTQAETLRGFIDERFPEVLGIAVAVGVRVVPRAEWESTSILENDTITIIRATRGG